MPDQDVIDAIIRIGRKRKMGREAILGALATGLVESNLTNISGGDRDSSGWRQERASLYPNPNNLTASINRFFNEWEQHDTPGFNPGLTSANVQRPAEQYRGRYGERMDEARAILEGRGVTGLGGGGGGTSGGDAVAPTSGPNILQAIADMNRPLVDQGNPLDQLIQGNWDLLAQISGSQAQTPRAPSGGGGGGNKPAPKRDLNGNIIEELFYDPMGGWDKGVNIGAIGGHQHVHVASKDKAILMAIARRAAKRGMSVREFAPFDPVDPVHTEGSHHYEDQAADISGSDAQERWLVNMIRRRYMR